jgi:hypothetical protein
MEDCPAVVGQLLGLTYLDLGRNNFKELPGVAYQPDPAEGPASGWLLLSETTAKGPEPPALAAGV